jgi:hypothetical protein
MVVIFHYLIFNYTCLPVTAVSKLFVNLVQFILILVKNVDLLGDYLFWVIHLLLNSLSIGLNGSWIQSYLILLLITAPI